MCNSMFDAIADVVLCICSLLSRVGRYIRKDTKILAYSTPLGASQGLNDMKNVFKSHSFSISCLLDEQRARKMKELY